MSRNATPRILVVEDSASIRELLGLHLTSAGYRVELAEDAIEAGKSFLHSPPDLLIVDVNLPYMNGFEFARTLKADTTLPRVPVIFLTGREDAAERMHDAGVSACLRKPIRADVLVREVARHLGNIEEEPVACGPDPVFA